MIWKVRDNIVNLLNYFEEATELKISIPKSKVMLFNRRKGRTKQIAGIQVVDKDVRHLGVMFNRNGVTNNFDSLLKRLIITLTSIKRLFLTFTAKISCLKAYGVNLFLYWTPYIAPTNKQILMYEKITRWFLYSNDMSFNKKGRYIGRISKKRLAMPKNKGGFYLPEIGTLFSLAKTQLVVMANNAEDCYIWGNNLKYYLGKFFKNTNLMVHPSFTNQKYDIGWKAQGDKWVKQMVDTHSKIPKQTTFQTEIGLNVHAFCPSISHPNCTIPAIPTVEGYKRCVNLSEWESFTTLEYERKVENFTRLRELREYMTPHLYKYENTNAQTKWENDFNFNLKDLYKKAPKVSALVVDFYQKTIRNYFWTKGRKCEFCGKSFSAFHIIFECQHVKKWEVDMYGTEKRDKRIRNSLVCSNKKVFAACWIHNWSIWKTRNFTVFQEDYDTMNILWREIQEHFHLHWEMERNEFEQIKNDLFLKKGVDETSYSFYCYYTVNKNKTIIKKRWGDWI